MPNLNLLPLRGTLVNNLTTALTTSGTSSALSVQMADSYRWILEVNTVSGTSPTLDVFLCTSADGGTNYYPFLHFAQATTSGQGQQLLMKPYLGDSDVATTSAAALIGVADGASGSTAIVQNGPINPSKIKVRSVISGTTPSFAFAVRYIGLAPGRK